MFRKNSKTGGILKQVGNDIRKATSIVKKVSGKTSSAARSVSNTGKKATKGVDKLMLKIWK